MWQIDPNQGLDDPTTVENNESTGGGTGTPADKIVLPPVKWVVNQPYNATTGTFGGGYTRDEAYKLIGNSNESINNYVHEFTGDINNAPNIPEGLTGGPTAFAAGPQIGDRVLFCDSYNNQYQFIYTITAVGEADVSPWELTPTDEISTDTAATHICYVVAVEETLIYATSAAMSMVDALNGTYGWRLQLDNSAAFGQSSFATGYNSFAVGWSSEASSNGSIALGDFTISRQPNSVAIGLGAQALEMNSVAIGYSSYVQYATAVAIGREAVTWGMNTVKVGSKAYGAVIHKIVSPTRTSTISFDTGSYGQIIPCNSESGFSISITSNVEAVGTETKFAQIGAGAITLTASGVTIHGKTATTGVGDVLTLICLAANLWVGY